MSAAWNGFHDPEIPSADTDTPFSPLSAINQDITETIAHPIPLSTFWNPADRLNQPQMRLYETSTLENKDNSDHVFISHTNNTQLPPPLTATYGGGNRATSDRYLSALGYVQSSKHPLTDSPVDQHTDASSPTSSNTLSTPRVRVVTKTAAVTLPANMSVVTNTAESLLAYLKQPHTHTLTHTHATSKSSASGSSNNNNNNNNNSVSVEDPHVETDKTFLTAVDPESADTADTVVVEQRVRPSVAVKHALMDSSVDVTDWLTEAKLHAEEALQALNADTDAVSAVAALRDISSCLSDYQDMTTDSLPCPLIPLPAHVDAHATHSVAFHSCASVTGNRFQSSQLSRGSVAHKNISIVNTSLSSTSRAVLDTVLRTEEVSLLGQDCFWTMVMMVFGPSLIHLSDNSNANSADTSVVEATVPSETVNFVKHNINNTSSAGPTPPSPPIPTPLVSLSAPLLSRMAQTYVSLFLRIPTKHRDGVIHALTDIMAHSVYLRMCQAYPLQSRFISMVACKEAICTVVWWWLNGTSPATSPLTRATAHWYVLRRASDRVAALHSSLSSDLKRVQHKYNVGLMHKLDTCGRPLDSQSHSARDNLDGRSFRFVKQYAMSLKDSRRDNNATVSTTSSLVTQDTGVVLSDQYLALLLGEHSHVLDLGDKSTGDSHNTHTNNTDYDDGPRKVVSLGDGLLLVCPSEDDYEDYNRVDHAHSHTHTHTHARHGPKKHASAGPHDDDGEDDANDATAPPTTLSCRSYTHSQHTLLHSGFVQHFLSLHARPSAVKPTTLTLSSVVPVNQHLASIRAQQQQHVAKLRGDVSSALDRLAVCRRELRKSVYQDYVTTGEQQRILSMNRKRALNNANTVGSALALLHSEQHNNNTLSNRPRHTQKFGKADGNGYGDHDTVKPDDKPRVSGWGQRSGPQSSSALTMAALALLGNTDVGTGGGRDGVVPTHTLRSSHERRWCDIDEDAPVVRRVLIKAQQYEIEKKLPKKKSADSREIGMRANQEIPRNVE